MSDKLKAAEQLAVSVKNTALYANSPGVKELVDAILPELPKVEVFDATDEFGLTRRFVKTNASTVEVSAFGTFLERAEWELSDLTDIQPLQEAKPPAPRELLERLEMIRDIIDGVDMRCGAVDWPVTPTNKEISIEEIRKIYQLAGGVLDDDE